MNKTDLSRLKKMSADYGIVVNDLKRSFNCEWDDEVHDSYSVFVQQLGNMAGEVRSICEKVCFIEEADDINVESLLQQADELCQEANEL